MRHLLFGASGVVLAYCVGAPATAQPLTEPVVVDDIIVTAQRRSESSQDVGQALSVVAGDILAERAVSIVNDLETVVPNLEVDSQFGGGQPQFRIRGIGAREYSSNNASTVGVYVDEAAHPYTVTTQGALFDIARIEILRGPQGTLYGRNTTGGAVNVITQAPTADPQAGLDIEYGSYERVRAEGFVSGPLATGLYGRLAAVREQGGAWQYNRDTGEALGDLDRTAVRGRLSWDASETTTADLSLTWSRDHSDGLGFRLLTPYVGSGGSPAYPADTERRITGWDISDQLAAVAGLPSDARPNRRNEGLDASLRVTADLGGATLTSITAYQSFDRNEYNDWDGTRLRESDVFFYNDIQTASQELRLASSSDGRLAWMVGAHVADERIDGGFYTEFRGIPNLVNTRYDQDVTAIGLFTHNSYELTERLRLIAGLRYEFEERSLSTPGTVVAPAAPPPARTYETDLSEISGRLGLEYVWSQDVLGYVSLARGVKSGGFTTYNLTSATPFRPEVVLAYEAGVRSDLFGGRLRLNGAAFFYDYADQQVQGLEYDRLLGRLGKITNVPRSHIYGGELELEWRPVAGLTVGQHLSYKWGEYDEFDAIDGAATDAANPPGGPWDVIIVNDRSGERLQFPRVNYGGWVAFDWVEDGLALRAETNYSHRSDLYSTSTSSIVPGYTTWNASLSAGPQGANWRVALWGRNLFDAYYEETRNGFNGSSRRTASPHQGRTVGVRLSVDF